MPELPDITVYIEALEERVVGATINNVLISSPFLLRTVEPAVARLVEQQVTEIQRIGKRVVLGLSNDHWMVIHLMIAGRFQWYDKLQNVPRTKALADIRFSTGTLRLTEAGSKRRASMHLFTCESDMRTVDRGGIEILQTDADTFKRQLTLRNHTLKRALTDQSLFSGIGNAYSDEILHHAQLSPVALSQKLSDDEITRLYQSTVNVLNQWTNTLRDQRAGKFPAKVTAFRKGMAVHGRYRKSCPVCETDIQRIRYVSNETNYCPRCQTGGKLLADRSLSRLLKKDWPRTIEALENAPERDPQKD